MSNEETNSIVKFFRDNSKLIQFIAWIIALIIGFTAWYGERTKNNALGDYVTIEQLEQKIIETTQKLSRRNDLVTDSILSKHNQDLAIALTKYAKEHIQPMYENDEVLISKVNSNQNVLDKIINGQSNITSELREQIKRSSIRDSLERENAKLRSQIKTQETVDGIFEELRNSFKKVNKDRIQ